MFYVFWIFVILLAVHFFTRNKEEDDNKSFLKTSLRELEVSLRRDTLVSLLERLYIEGYIFGEPALGATLENPKLVSHSGLASMLDDMAGEGILENTLPRIGFSIRTLANCNNIEFVRQYNRMLVTPANYAIGYGSRQ